MEIPMPGRKARTVQRPMCIIANNQTKGDIPKGALKFIDDKDGPEKAFQKGLHRVCFDPQDKENTFVVAEYLKDQKEPTFSVKGGVGNPETQKELIEELKRTII